VAPPVVEPPPPAEPPAEGDAPAAAVVPPPVEAPLELLPVADIAALLPNQNKSTVFGVHNVLDQIPTDFVDKDSVKENDEVNDAWKARLEELSTQICIMRDKTREEVNEIPNGKSKLLPWRLLPNHTGVEFRSAKSYSYRTGSHTYAAEVKLAQKDLEDSIAHCRKLLVDLPIALQNSKAALESKLKANDAQELSEIGAIVVEQQRISQELDIQTKRLEALLATPIPTLEKARFTSYSRQASAVLKIGYNTVAGKTYHLMHRAHAVEVAEIDPLLEVGEILPAPLAQKRMPEALDAEAPLE